MAEVTKSTVIPAVFKWSGTPISTAGGADSREHLPNGAAMKFPDIPWTPAADSDNLNGYHRFPW